MPTEVSTVLSDEDLEVTATHLQDARMYLQDVAQQVLMSVPDPIAAIGIALNDNAALCATVKALRAERLEIQRSLASSVLNDPTEDNDPPYSTTELVNGILGLISRKESLLTRYVTLQSRLSEVERERDRFAALADQRHYQLWEARRQRDDLAARCAPYLENLK